MPINPEQNANEVWVGNTHYVDGNIPYLSALKTARVGSVAYDIHGKKIPTNYCRPLFIGVAEYQKYDEIMMARLRA